MVSTYACAVTRSLAGGWFQAYRDVLPHTLLLLDWVPWGTFELGVRSLHLSTNDLIAAGPTTQLSLPPFLDWNAAFRRYPVPWLRSLLLCAIP